jgi:putative transposase
MSRPPRYPSDLSDAEWSLLKPLLASSEKRGHPPKWPLRRVTDAVFYLLRSGCSWRMLPREYPPWQTVYYHFRRWRLDGRLRRAHDRLRKAVREAEGRARDPTAAVIDSQVVKTTRVGGPERGYDGAKRLAGRKRHILVDTNGLVLAARVHGANLPTGTAVGEVVGRGTAARAAPAGAGLGRWGVRERVVPRVDAARARVARGSTVYHRDRQLWRYGLEEKPCGFQVLPRRWVVERTFAWLGQSRRLFKDYERMPEKMAEAVIYAVMSRIMLRRLARTA